MLRIRISAHLEFSIRSSCEERLESAWYLSKEEVFFNPRSSCEERRERADIGHLPTHISIHAPSCEERPPMILSVIGLINFQSTPLARSDIIVGYITWRLEIFNPRSSCEERRLQGVYADMVENFQSTLLLRGATLGSLPTSKPVRIFQSTLLLRGATKDLINKVGQTISIRSSCEERRIRYRHGTTC